MTGGTKRQKEMRRQLRGLAPRAPFGDTESILEIALSGHLRHLPPSIALWQAVTTYVRHEMTGYDRLLEDGYDRDAARFFVIEDMNDVLDDWGCCRRVESEEESNIA